MSVFFLVGVAALLLQQSEAMLTKGSIIVPARKPVFLTKFSFDFAEHGPILFFPGYLHMEFLDASPQIGTYEVVVFDDQAYSFPDEGALRDWQCGSHSLKQAAKLEWTINASQPVWRTTMSIDERLRPRWWYVAVIDCSGVERKLDYSLHMTNPRLGWQKEFSMDQCGITSMGFFLAVYGILFLAQLKAVIQNSDKAQTKHPLRLLLLSANFFAACALLAFVLDANWFANSGASYASLHLVGKFLKACSKLVTASILLLLSQGVGITQHFRLQDLRMLLSLAPFFVACFALEAWGEYAQSRMYTTGFVYCTWVGAVLVIGDLCLLAVYLKSLHGSYANSVDTEKQNVFWFWGQLYSCAFVALPFAALLSMILNPWVRSEALFLLTNGVQSILLALLIVGLWPERTQSAFCIDLEVLPKTIGTTSELSGSVADSSPCLLKTLRRPSTDDPKKGNEYSFFIDLEDRLP